MPVFSILLIASTILFAWRDLRQEPAAKAPDQPHSSGLVRYQVTLDSFDINTQTVHARAQVFFSPVPVKSRDAQITDYPQPFYCQSQDPFRVDLSKPSVFVGFGGRVQFSDLGRTYSQGGLRRIQDVQPLGPCDPKQTEFGFVQYSIPVQAELYAVGDSRKFPFDRYLLIYRVWTPVLVQRPDGGYLGILGLNDVDSKLAGFSMKYPSSRQIETWSTPPIADQNLPPVTYNEQMWAGRQVAVTLERGFFIQGITIFLGGVVLVYLFLFAFVRKKKETWTPDILGFFITVWAIRSALSVGGPNTATVIDYAALCSYVCFIGIFICRVASDARSGRA
jgi:hypothetical protein